MYEEKIMTKEDELHSAKRENEELDDRVRLLEDQLREANSRLDQMYKLEIERRGISDKF